VRDETDLAQTVARTVLVDVGVDLLGQPHPHFPNVSLSVVLVGRGHQEHDFGEDEGDVVLDHLHVLRVPLEPMHQYPQMHPVLIKLLGHDLFDAFTPVILKQVLQFLSLLLEATHVLDEALLENDGLKVLEVSQGLLSL